MVPVVDEEGRADLVLLEEELAPDVPGDRPLEEDLVEVGELADGGVHGEVSAGLPQVDARLPEPEGVAQGRGDHMDDRIERQARLQLVRELDEAAQQLDLATLGPAVPGPERHRSPAAATAVPKGTHQSTPVGLPAARRRSPCLRECVSAGSRLCLRGTNAHAGARGRGGRSAVRAPPAPGDQPAVCWPSLRMRRASSGVAQGRSHSRAMPRDAADELGVLLRPARPCAGRCCPRTRGARCRRARAPSSSPACASGRCRCRSRSTPRGRGRPGTRGCAARRSCCPARRARSPSAAAGRPGRAS